MSHIFINYSRADTDIAQQLRDALERGGYVTWLDQLSIDIGADWAATIREAVDRCSAMLLVMTPASEKSEWVQQELKWAMGAKKSIIPVLVEGEPWALVSHLQFLDARDGVPIEALLKATSVYVQPTPPDNRPPRKKATSRRPPPASQFTPEPDPDLGLGVSLAQASRDMLDPQQAATTRARAIGLLQGVLNRDPANAEAQRWLGDLARDTEARLHEFDFDEAEALSQANMYGAEPNPAAMQQQISAQTRDPLPPIQQSEEIPSIGGERLIVNVNGLNIRSQPDPAALILTVARMGQPLSAFDLSQHDDGSWWREVVTDQGVNGWVLDHFLVTEQAYNAQASPFTPTETAPSPPTDFIASGSQCQVGNRRMVISAIMQHSDGPVLVLATSSVGIGTLVLGENGDPIGEIIDQSSGFAIARLQGSRAFSAALPDGQPLRGVSDWDTPRPLLISTTDEAIDITHMADRYRREERWAWTIGRLDRASGQPTGTLLLDRDDNRASGVILAAPTDLKAPAADNYIPLSWAMDDFGLTVITDSSPLYAPVLPNSEIPLPTDPAEIIMGSGCRVGNDSLVISAIMFQKRQPRLVLLSTAPRGSLVYAENGDLIGEVIDQRGVFALAKLVGSRTFAAVLPDGHPLDALSTREYQLRLTISTTHEQVMLLHPPTRLAPNTSSRTTPALALTALSRAPAGYRDDDAAEGVIEWGLIERPVTLPPMGSLLLETGTRSAYGVVASSLLLEKATSRPAGLGAGRPPADDGIPCVPLEWAVRDFDLTLIPTPQRFRVKENYADTLNATRDRIGVDDKDRLGVTPYVVAFERLVRDTDPPLTVGIYGKWGSGKTFIMNQVALRLNPTWKRKERRQRRKTLSLPRWRRSRLPTDLHPLIVWFEAWDYIVTDKLWSGLLERIFHELENAEGIDAWQQLRLNVKRNWERQRLRGRARLWPLVLFGGILAIIVGGLSLLVEDTLAARLGGITFVGAAMIAAAQTLLTTASQRVSELFTSADYRNDLNFMGNIREDLQAFAKSLPGQLKVAVFIDDLDRCDPKKAVEVLEAVKLLLDFERSPFIVFIGLDARIITQAIEQHYGAVLSEAKITGYEYLDKIVQIPFSIPEPRPEDLRDYLGSLVNVAQTETAALAPSTALPTPTATPSAGDNGDRVGNQPSAPPRPIESQPPALAEADEADNQPLAPPPTIAPAPSPVGSPPPAEQTPIPTVELEDTVAFTRAEQTAFMGFNPHIDPNPRRIKRLVNVYRLVRVLLKVQPPSLPFDPRQQATLVMGWLTLCEQWPYAAHCLLETLPLMSPHDHLPTLYEAAQGMIGDARADQLRRLDLEYDRLAKMIEDRLNTMTCQQLEALRRYTVNFNPALSAEVRLTLLMAE